MSRFSLFLSCSLSIIASLGYGEIATAILQMAPDDTALIVEIPAPVELVDKLMSHPGRSAIEALPQYQEAIKSPQYAVALATKAWFEGQLGAPWQEAFKVAAGRGLYLLVKDSGIVLIGRSPQPERLDRLLPLLAKLATKGANGEVKPVHQEGGINVYKIGDTLACRAGDYLFFSNQPKLLQSIVLKSREEKPASRAESWELPKSIQNAQTDVRWVGKPEAIAPLAKILHDAREPINDTGVALLLGGIIQTVAQTGTIAGTVVLSNQALTMHSFARSDCEPGKSVLPLVAVCFGEQLNAVAPIFDLSALKPLAQLGTVRDFGRFWLQRGDFLSSQAAANLDVADSQLSTVFGGFDFGDEILGASAGPLLAVAVAPRDEQGVAQLGYPMIAGVFQFREGKQDAADRYRLAFQSAVSLSNVQRAQSGGVQWGLVSDKYQSFEVVSTRSFFTQPQKSKSETSAANTWTKQQLPTLATNERYVVIASHRRLADQVMDVLLKSSNPQPETAASRWQTQFDIHGSESIAWLKQNREMLVAQNMLEKGHSRTAAEAEFDLGVAVLRHFEHLTINLRLQDGWLEQHASLTLAGQDARP